MMKEQMKKAKLKGTVLYTVISVLMVLIVFLMGTLALAATANNRAMNNYNSAQTQYTAKSAVQAVMAAMQNDTGVAQKVANITATNPSATVTVDFGVSDEDSAQAASLGRITSAKVEYAGTKWVLNEDENDENYGLLEEKVVVKITATAQQGRETSTVSAYVLKDAKPQESTGGGGGGFVSTGTASNVNHTSAFGGTYVGYDSTSIGASMDITNPAAFETDFHINGDLNVRTDMDLVIKEPGTGMTIWGDIHLDNGGIYISTVNADKTIFDSKALSYTDIPYIYVEGTISGANNIELGNADTPLNIFCAAIDTTDSRNNKIWADVYCYDETATSHLAGNESRLYSWIANVVELNAAEASQHVAGNFYTKGNLEVPAGNPTQTIDGEVYVAGDMTINKKTEVLSDVWVGGTLTLNAELVVKNGTVHCDNIVNPERITIALPDGVVMVPAEDKLREGYTSADAALAETDDGYGNITQHWVIPGSTDDGILDPGDIISPVSGRVVLGGDGKYHNFYYDPEIIMPPLVYYNNAGLVVAKEEATELIPEHLEKVADGSWVTDVETDIDLTYDGTDSKFPSHYEKAVILGETPLAGSDSVANSKIITTVEDVMASAINPYNTLYDVPDTYQGDVSTRVFTLGGDVSDPTGTISYDAGTKTYTVTGSCTLSGSLDGQKVVFLVETGDEIWVQVDGLSGINGSQLILDDTVTDEDGIKTHEGKLNLLVNGNITFSGNNNTMFPIIEKSIQSLMETGTDFQIYTSTGLALDDESVPTIGAIKINMYCAKNGDNGYKLSVNNATMISANIMAPYLELCYNSNTYEFSNKIWYNRYEVKNGTDTSSDEEYKKVGCIGCCVIKTFGSDAGGQCDNFMLLYVPRDLVAPEDDDFDDALMTGWRVLYYENY